MPSAYRAAHDHAGWRNHPRGRDMLFDTPNPWRVLGSNSQRLPFLDRLIVWIPKVQDLIPDDNIGCPKLGPLLPARGLYAVNKAANDRGSISVYDIDAGHRLVKTIATVPNVGDVRGVAGPLSLRHDAPTRSLLALSKSRGSR
jgi:hypothetical protein